VGRTNSKVGGGVSIEAMERWEERRAMRKGEREWHYERRAWRMERQLFGLFVLFAIHFIRSLVVCVCRVPLVCEATLLSTLQWRSSFNISTPWAF
jgi:hypothetical protein